MSDHDAERFGPEATQPVLLRSESAAARAGVTLVALNTLPTLAIAALVAILPTLSKRFGTEPHAEWLVPMILTVPSLCVAVFSMPIGWLSDRVGRRVILLPALMAFALFGLGPFLADSLYGIIATRCVVGVAEAAVMTVTNSLIGDYFQGAVRQKWLAVQTIAGPFAAFAYVAAGGTLGAWSWRGPFLMYLVGLLILLPSLWTLPEPLLVGARQESRRAMRRAVDFPWRTALIVGCATLLVSLVFFVQNVQHGRIFSDLGADNPRLLGWVINAAGIGSVVGGLIYYFYRPLNVQRSFALIFAAYGLGYLGLAFVPNFWVGIPFDALGQIGSGYCIPVLIAWCLSRYPLEHRGRGMGLWGACFFIGQFLSPMMVTVIAHGQWSFLHTVGVIGAACLVIAALIWVRSRAATGNPKLRAALVSDHANAGESL